MHISNTLVRAVLLSVIVASRGASQSALTSPERVSGWRSDIDTIVAVAGRAHAGPTKPARSASFVQAAAQLKSIVPTSTDDRLATEVQKLLAMVGDGHSLLYPAPGKLVSFSMLPIEVYLFDDGLYVVGGEGAAQSLVGSRIERMGPLPVDELLHRMAPYVSRDNEMANKSFVSVYLVTTAFLEAMGATQHTSKVTLEVVDSRAQRRTVELAATNGRRTRRRLYPPPGARDTLPTYLKYPDRPYWLTRISSARALYLQFNQVGNAPEMPLSAFATALRDSLAASRVDRLIIDVRNNPGGNNQLLAPLIATIETFARANSNRVYIITGRATFSAAQNFINRVEQRVPNVVFAGEPSMSSPNFTGEDNTIPLRYSGLFVSISNRYWQDSSADDSRPWIKPHLRVTMKSSDWLDNRDPVLAAVLGDLRKPR